VREKVRYESYSNPAPSVTEAPKRGSGALVDLERVTIQAMSAVAGMVGSAVVAAGHALAPLADAAWEKSKAMGLISD
jgi:hypothetical protein